MQTATTDHDFEFRLYFRPRGRAADLPVIAMTQVECERCGDVFPRDDEQSISVLCAPCIAAEAAHDAAEAAHDDWLHDGYDREHDR